MAKQEHEALADYEDGFDIRDGVPDEKYMPRVEPARFCQHCGMLLDARGNCPVCQC